MIAVGRCAECKLDVYEIRESYQQLLTKINDYKIKAVPTIVIDGKIKIEGLPEFNFICSKELYEWLEKEFSFR